MAPSSVDFTAREVYQPPSMSLQKANAASIVAAHPLIVIVTLLKSVTLIDPAWLSVKNITTWRVYAWAPVDSYTASIGLDAAEWKQVGTDSSGYWMTDWFISWLIGCLIGWLTDWPLTDSFTASLLNKPTRSFADTDWMTDRLDILTKGGAGEGWVDIWTRNQGKDNQIDESMDGQTDR